MAKSQDPGALGVGDASILAQVLADSVAEAHGVRALAIKGSVHNHHGLRRVRASADADVLVCPEDFDRFVELLADVGWGPRNVSWLSNAVDGHSWTLYAEHWPCSLDIHSRFPGLLVEPMEAFEILWDRRTSLVVAGQPVVAVDRASAILIAALHSLRSPLASGRNRAEIQEIANSVIPALDAHGYLELVDLAIGLGAADSARAAFANRPAALPPPTRPGASPALDAWRLRSASGGVRAALLYDVFRTARWPMRMRIVFEYLWPAPSELDAEALGQATSIARRNRLRARRIGRGARTWRNVLRGIRFSRAGRDDTALVDGELPW